jgi:Leucine Rich repeats (2 copies)
VQLEELECEDATKVSNIGFLGRTKQSSFQITRLNNLRRVNFTGMARLNDRMLRTITNQTLQHLDISCCRSITSEGVKALLHQLPSLEVLNLNGNPQITTRILNYAANQDCAPRLKDILMKCKFESCRL